MKYITLFLFFAASLFAVNPVDELIGKYHTDKGNVYLKKGDYEKALFKYTLAKKSIPENENIEYNIGNVFFSEGYYQKARISYENTKDLFTKKTGANFKSQVYYNSGINSIKLLDYDRAISELIQSLKLNPNDKDATTALEYARKQKKNKSGNQGKNSNPPKNSGNNGKNNEQPENSDESSNTNPSDKDLPISKEEAKRILDGLRSKREEKLKTDQKYSGGGVEKDW